MNRKTPDLYVSVQKSQLVTTTLKRLCSHSDATRHCHSVKCPISHSRCASHSLYLLWTGLHLLNQSDRSVLSLSLWKQRATRSLRLCQQRCSFVINLGVYLNRDVPHLSTFGHSCCRIFKIRAIALVLTLKASVYRDAWCHILTVVRCPIMDNKRYIIDTEQKIACQEARLVGEKSQIQLKCLLR